MRRVGLSFGLLLVAAFAWAITAVAATTYSDYVVYGEHGVFIGAGSQVTGLVGARHNNSLGYPDATEALGMNGASVITGDARIGEDVNTSSVSSITGTLYRVGTLNAGHGAIGTDMPVADADLPAASLVSQSVWPGGFGTNCPPAGGADHTGLPNGFDLTLNAGNSYGDIQGGGINSHLRFNGAGDYFLNSLHVGSGLTIHIPTPGVRVFVCDDVVLGSGHVDPLSLPPGQFTMEVAGGGVAAGDAAFTATGFDWIGNLLVPTRGIQFGTGGGGATWLGYLWGDHVDIEHGVVLTKLAKKAGVKWNDMNGNGVRNLPEDVGKAGFTIQLRDSFNTTVVQSALTDADGKYEFVDIFPGTYYVCEVQLPNWVQTYPNASTPDPSANDLKTDQCPGDAKYGYLINVVNGDDLNGDDFGNTKLASKSGTKWEDQLDDGTPPFEATLDGWKIHLFGTDGLGNAVDLSTTTGPNGAYSFANLYPGNYTVCEELLDATWTQTYPIPGTDLNACEGKGYAAGGYSFTLVSGQNETGNDFANFHEPVFSPPECKEDPNRTFLQTRTVDKNRPQGGPSPVNYWSIQDAYNDAASNAGEVIGLYSNTNENLTLGGAKTLTITQCTLARVTGAAGSPVWDITSTGKLTIIGPDSVGGSIGWRVAGNGGHTLKSIRANGASQYGVLVVSSSNSVSWNDVSGNGTTIADAGIRAQGGSNTLKGGTVSNNKGDGVQLIGSNNNLSGSTITGNTGNGVFVAGSTNTVTSNSRINLNKLNGIYVTGSSNTLSSNASEAGKGNLQNGIYVTGSTNQITGNKMNSNGQAGYSIAGSGNKLKSNNTSNNTGLEYSIGAGNTDQGGNKKNGSSFTFTSAGGTFN